MLSGGMPVRVRADRETGWAFHAPAGRSAMDFSEAADVKKTVQEKKRV